MENKNIVLFHDEENSIKGFPLTTDEQVVIDNTGYRLKQRLQTIGDPSDLNTENKNIVGAINEIKSYLEQPIVDKRLDEYDILSDTSQIVLSTPCNGKEYLTIIYNNTALNSSTYTLENDGITVNFINPIKYSPNNSILQANYTIKVGSFINTYTKDEIDKKIGVFTTILENRLNGVI